MATSAVRKSGGAVDVAVQRIREKVAAGEWAPGQRLVEPDLAAQLGISRPSLREAFRALEAEGLVRMERYKGASVRRLDPTELAELFEIRELLEGLAARRAAPRLALPPERARLLALLAEMEAAAASPTDGHAYTALNRKFHDLVLEAAGSDQLSALGAYIRPPAIVRIIHQRLLDHVSIAHSMAQHRAVFQALLAGDGEAAERAMRTHIRGSLQSAPFAPGKAGADSDHHPHE